MNKFSKYVGLDTHKDTNAVGIANAGRSKPRYYGEIANYPKVVEKVVKKRSKIDIWHALGALLRVASCSAAWQCAAKAVGNPHCSNLYLIKS